MRRLFFLAIAFMTFASSATAADWISLLKGDKLADWEAGGGEQSFTIKDGVLTVKGTGQTVYWPDGKPLDLKDFELKAEVLTQPGGRAGLTFHLSGNDPRSSGGIEIRLDNNYGPPA